MNQPRRLDPFDLDQHPDEELPSYDDVTAPAYHSDGHFTPLFTYHLRQIDRKLQMFVPYGTSAPSSYKLFTHHFRLFSKKPDMELFRASHSDLNAERIASISFINDGPLPWRPRAHFSYARPDGESTHAMESRNFADWTAAIGGITYRWTLEAKPVSLILSETTESVVIARFTYSARGTLASRGAEVGDLTVFRDQLSIERAGLEKILCSLMVAITHLKRMGRHYSNDAPIRAGSLTREHLPSHRTSFSSSWISET